MAGGSLADGGWSKEPPAIASTTLNPAFHRALADPPLARAVLQAFGYLVV